MVEWKEALCSANAYERIAKELKNHVPWGTTEQTAIGEVIPHLKKKTYMHWEEDIKRNKLSWEVKDHPKKDKKCGKCHHFRHFYHSCPFRAANQQMVTWWTIGTLLLTDLLTIYIHLSHTPAGVIITSPTLFYLPSNLLQPHSVACTSLQIITR